jgi:diacylglycerol kinase family enzyme
MALKKAIMLIEKGKIIAIDAIKINNNYFFCSAGVGIDAHISWKFAEAPKRGLSTYFKLTIKSIFNYKPLNYVINYNEQQKEFKKVMLATFANANQFGNNVIISPNSVINDGFVRLIVVKKFPAIYAPIFAYYLLTKQVTKSKYTEEIKSKKITLHSPEQKIHIDGEPIKMDNKIEVETIPSALKILVP